MYNPKNRYKENPDIKIITIRGLFVSGTTYIESETGEQFEIQEPWWFERRKYYEYFNLKKNLETNKYWLLQRFLPRD